MRRTITVFAVLGFVAFFACFLASPAQAAEAPAHRVVVIYFHRTQRCPTCLKMGGLSEEAVRTGFAPEIKEGKVEFHFIDFQDKKNEALAKGYRIGGPALIVANVVDNKVVDRKDLKEIWTKVRGDTREFIEYVQHNVEDYLK